MTPDVPSGEPQTLGEEVIAWIEEMCRVPEGALLGQPIQLMPWQRDAIRRTYDNPHGTGGASSRSAANPGKTTFAGPCFTDCDMGGLPSKTCWAPSMYTDFTDYTDGNKGVKPSASAVEAGLIKRTSAGYNRIWRKKGTDVAKGAPRLSSRLPARHAEGSPRAR